MIQWNLLWFLEDFQLYSYLIFLFLELWIPRICLSNKCGEYLFEVWTGWFSFGFTSFSKLKVEFPAALEVQLKGLD